MNYANSTNYNKKRLMNNNLKSSSAGKCKCGRYMTIGEWQMGIQGFGYKCPDCRHREYAKPLTAEDYYQSFKLI